MKAAMLIFLCNSALAQELKPVAGPGSSIGLSDWTIGAIGIAMLIAAVVGGFIYWHRKNPTQADAAAAKALADAHSGLQTAIDELAKAVHTLDAKLTAASAPTAVVAPGPTPEQLAAIALKETELADAKKAAGLT